MANPKSPQARRAPKPQQVAKPRASSPAVTVYLLAYNVLAALGWSYILAVTLAHLFDVDLSLNLGVSASSEPEVAPGALASARAALAHALQILLAYFPFLRPAAGAFGVGVAAAAQHPLQARIAAHLPAWARVLLDRAATSYGAVGPQTKIVQSTAILEIVHVLLGFVRSPLATTVAQVWSRLFLVWGVAAQFDVVRTSPLYATMVLAWSATEVVRYSFYGCNLLGREPYPLLWLRYTTFYILYPIGAGSEAALMFSTLPNAMPFGAPNALFPDPPNPAAWTPGAYFRAFSSTFWFVGFYVLYTHMIKQRRKALGSGRKLSSKPKTL